MTHKTIVIGKHSNLSNHLVDKLNNATVVSSRDIMSDVNITVEAGDAFTVEVSSAVSAASTIYDPSGSDLSATDLQTVIDELANEKFAQTTAPTVGVSEGDLWYDTDDDELKVRRDSAWVEIVQEDLSGDLDGGSYI